MGFKIRNNVALFTLMLMLSGCGGSSSAPDTPDIPDIPVVNTPPVLVVTAPTQTIDAQQDTVTLAITASDDKSVASYSWSQTAGIPVTLTDTTTASAHFNTPQVNHGSGAEQLEFQVIVTDSENATTSALLAVTIEPNNHMPTVTIAAVADVHSGDTVQMTADAIDVDGTITNYQWQQLSGTSVTINNADTSNPSFVAPQTALNETLSFEITVTDDKQTSTTASVNVNVSAVLQTPPEIVTLPKVIAKSGAFTVIEWAINSEDPQVTVAVSQTGQQSDLTIVMTDQNKAYFTAPAATAASSRTLKLTATDSEGQSTETDVELEIQPSATTIYPQNQTIHTFNNQGHEISEFDVADMNGDGISDIITREADGSFWYKNKGNLDIDLTPNKIRGEVPRNRNAYDLLEDINGDGLVDMVIYQSSGDGYSLYFLPNDGNGKFNSVELIGALPGANAYPFSSDITVATFTTANTQGKYITLALTQNNKGLLYVFAPSPTGYTLVSNKSFNNKGPVLTSIVACDIKKNGNADLFYQLREYRAGAGDRQSSLHVLSGDDNYQTDTQIDESPLYNTAFACLSSDDKQRLIQFRGTSNGDVTVEINYDSSQSTYNAIEFDSVIASDRPNAEEFAILDVNGDNIDDLVALDMNGRKTAVFLRLDNTSLAFTKGYLLCNCLITPWAETSDYRQYQRTNNTLWISSEFTGGDPYNDANGNRVKFDPVITNRDIQFINDNVIIKQTDANYQHTYSAFKVLDGQLTPDMSFDMTLFDHGLPQMTDFNNDGKLDALYSYRIQYLSRNRYDDLFVAVRLASDQGYEPEKILFTVSGTFETPRSIQSTDVNGDGYPDIALNYHDEYAFQTWWLYEPQSNTYIQDSSGGLYNSDIDSYFNSFFRSFTDFDGNHLNDIFRLGELNEGCRNGPPQTCGILQVNMQDSPGQFGNWIDVDPQRYSFQDIKIIDINQDGRQNLFISGNPWREDQNYPNTTSKYWYQFDQDGIITKHQANAMPNRIVDIYGTDHAYLVDFHSNNKMTPFHYSELAKMPVPTEMQTLPITLNFSPRFIDIDKDNDLDIIHYDDDHIYLIENKVK